MDWTIWRSSPFNEEAGADDGVSDSGGTVCTSATSTCTEGTKVQLIASTARDAHNIIVCLGPRSSLGGIGSNVTLYVGAASSEVPIVNGLLVTSLSDTHVATWYSVPLFIPKGSRVSCSCEDNTSAAVDCEVSIILQGGGPFPSAPFNSIESLNWGCGFGTSLDPGGTANTKPTSWTELEASINGNYRALIAFLHQDNSTLQNANWLVDIAVGAASSEQVIVPNLRAASGQSKDTMLPCGGLGPFPCNIPKGSRVSARAQCSSTAVNDRNIYLQLYGLY